MTLLADLHRTVQAILASHRLGRPVFVRYHWYSPDPPEVMSGRLAQLTAAVRAWLNQDLDRLYALAAGDRTHVSLTWQFQAGATALIGCTRTPAGEPRVDLMILGNRGALYHEEDAVLPGEDFAIGAMPPSDPVIQDRIERALQSGQPT